MCSFDPAECIINSSYLAIAIAVSVALCACLQWRVSSDVSALRAEQSIVSKDDQDIVEVDVAVAVGVADARTLGTGDRS